MSRYISFNELREKYKLAEIFDFLQAGLQPLSDPSLFPIPCPKEHHECTNLPKVIEYLITLKASEQSDAGNGFDNLIKKYKETIELAEADDPEHQSWKYFVPPMEEPDTTNVIFDDPLLNKLKTLSFSPRDSEPENKELNDVVSLLSKAIFEEKNLNEVKKKIDKSHTEKQSRYDPFAKIIKRAIQKFIVKNPGQLPSVKQLRQIIEKDHNKMSREFDSDCIIQSISGTNFKIKIKGENKLISKSAFEKRATRLMKKDFSK